MQIYITYFYKIRFFPLNLVPVSTAMYDPLWYKPKNGKGYVFRDKRGIYNGIRIEELNPSKISHVNDCSLCNKQDYGNCGFLTSYREYIYSLDFDNIINQFNNILKFTNCEDICLIVHEKPDNPCSERSVLIDWFNDHGYHIEEWEDII